MSKIISKKRLWFALAIAALLHVADQPAKAEGIDLDAALKSNSSPADWISDTVKANRKDWRPLDSEVPDELFQAFFGAPFSAAINDKIQQAKNPCDVAALNAAYAAVNEWEMVKGSAIGGFVQFIGRWAGRAKAGYDLATGGSIREQVEDAVVDQAKDIGKDAGKDALKGNDPAIQQKIEDKVTDAYNRVMDLFKDGPRVFWDEKKVGSCALAMLWVWSKGAIDLYVNGTCDCPPGQKVALRRFVMQVHAKTFFDKSDSDHPRVAVSSSDMTVSIKSDCSTCGPAASQTAGGQGQGAGTAGGVTVDQRPYQPIDGKRVTCEACKSQLKLVLDLQHWHEELGQRFSAARLEVDALNREVSLLQDQRKPIPVSLTTKAVDKKREVEAIGRQELQALIAWRAAMAALELCEKSCKTSATGGTDGGKSGTGGTNKPNDADRGKGKSASGTGGASGNGGTGAAIPPARDNGRLPVGRDVSVPPVAKVVIGIGVDEVIHRVDNGRTEVRDTAVRPSGDPPLAVAKGRGRDLPVRIEGGVGGAMQGIAGAGRLGNMFR